MALNYRHVSTKIVCVGETGSRKSQRAMRFVLESNYRYYFIFDHDGQFADRHRLTPAYTLKEVCAQLDQQRFVIFNPTEMFDEMGGDFKPEKDPRSGGFDWFCRFAYDFSERVPKKLDGPKLLYCDEIADIVSTSKMPKYARKVFTSGRNRSLDAIVMTVQYNLIHNTIRAGASNTFAFRTTEENAVAALVARGFNEAQVRALPDGHFIMRDVRGKMERGVQPQQF